jgi:hypothetical protein
MNSSETIKCEKVMSKLVNVELALKNLEANIKQKEKLNALRVILKILMSKTKKQTGVLI